MDKHSILKSIKVLLGLEEAPAAPGYTLADGTPITISELAPGGAVMVGDQPAPQGEHTLSDGTVIVVTEPGVIAEVKAPAPVEAATDPAPPAEPAAMPVSEDKIAAIVEKVVKEIVEEELKGYKQKMATQEKAMSQLVALVGDILKTPATEPKQENKTQFARQTESKTEKFARLRHALENIKN